MNNPLKAQNIIDNFLLLWSSILFFLLRNTPINTIEIN